MKSVLSLNPGNNQNFIVNSSLNLRGFAVTKVANLPRKSDFDEGLHKYTKVLLENLKETVRVFYGEKDDIYQ